MAKVDFMRRAYSPLAKAGEPITLRRLSPLTNNCLGIGLLWFGSGAFSHLNLHEWQNSLLRMLLSQDI